MLDYELIEELKLGEYDPGIGTVVGFRNHVPIGDGQLEFKFENDRDSIAMVLGYYHGMPVYDPSAPELQGGHQDD